MYLTFYRNANVIAAKLTLELRLFIKNQCIKPYNVRIHYSTDFHVSHAQNLRVDFSNVIVYIEISLIMLCLHR